VRNPGGEAQAAEIPHTEFGMTMGPTHVEKKFCDWLLTLKAQRLFLVVNFNSIPLQLAGV
jgi:hypothetical protein